MKNRDKGRHIQEVIQ